MTLPAPNCLAVCGTTASGKTRLGVQLALDLGGEILSADSRQVYRGMDLGSGKDLEEYTTPRGRVPCHLIDVADPAEVYSLFDYQRDFYRVFEEVCSRGHLPVIVGGTGLYIEAVFRKFDVPDVPADEAFRAAMAARTLEELAAELKTLSPAIHAATVLDCKRRVVRALEVARYEAQSGKPPLNETDREFHPLILLVTWPAEELRERIRSRLLERLDKGLIGEVRRLLGSGISPERYRLFGMEYKHVARHVAGSVPYGRMVDDLCRDIWYLARRQRTYFRGIQKRGLEVHEVPRADLERAREIIHDRPPAVFPLPDPPPKLQ